MSSVINLLKNPFVVIPASLSVASTLVRDACEINKATASSICQGASGMIGLAQQMQGLFIQTTIGITGLGLVCKGIKNWIPSMQETPVNGPMRRQVRARRGANGIELYRPFKERAGSAIKKVASIVKPFSQIAMGLSLAAPFFTNFPENYVLSWKPLEVVENT